MEDVIEEVVGDIDVVYEFEEYLPKKRRRFKVVNPQSKSDEMDARLPISEVRDLLGLSLPANEFHTVAGLIIARLRRMPKPDESIVESGYRLTVHDMPTRTIRSVIVDRSVWKSNVERIANRVECHVTCRKLIRKSEFADVIEVGLLPVRSAKTL